jgi:hypothetical protein
MWKGLAASVLAHALAAVVIGAMPRGTSHQVGPSESAFEEVPAVVTMETPEEAPQEARAETKPPEQRPQPNPTEPPKLAQHPPDPPRTIVAKEPEPKTVKLGSPTSTSEAATMTWIGFDEFIEHGGSPSEVDQAQFTMEAPGPRGAVPSEGVAANPGMPVAPPPSPVARAEPQAQPPAAAASPPIARAMDEPLLIADEERRPPSTPEPASPAEAQSATDPSTTLAAEKKGKNAPQAPTPRPPEAEVGPAREKVEPTAPAPLSLPKEVRSEDKEEIAAPAQGTTPGESTVTPREAVPGQAETPQFPVANKAIEPSKDKNAKEGPSAESVKERRPENGSDGKGPDGTGKGEGDAKTADVIEPQQSPPPAPEPESPAAPRNPENIPAGNESQGPRPDPSRATENNDRAGPKAPSKQPSDAIPTPPITPGTPVQPRVGTGQEGRGVLSDRESLAAAIKKAVIVDKWGQPLVAKGLRIRTVRPKFSKYTQITASGSPVIRICFDRAGKAREVIVLSSSGVVDVDRPVVDAAYQWTATGKELEELRENPPEIVAIDVRVIR